MRNLLLFLAAVIAAIPAVAGETDVLAQLRAKYPSTHFDSATETPLPGIYELRMGDNIAYTNQHGDLWLFGHLYDMTANRDLTAERLNGNNKTAQSVGTAPAMDTQDATGTNNDSADAIVRVKGTGGRTLVVYSDTDCPYCRKLESELAQLDDVTIVTYPVAFVSDGSRAEDVWCSSDRATAWDDVMRGKNIRRAAGACATPIERNTQRALKLGVRATPTLIRSDGERLAGMTSATRIEAWLAAAR